MRARYHTRSIYRGRAQHVIACSTTISKVKFRSHFELTKKTHTSATRASYGCLCELCGEKRPRDIGSALYLVFAISLAYLCCTYLDAVLHSISRYLGARYDENRLQLPCLLRYVSQYLVYQWLPRGKIRVELYLKFVSYVNCLYF